MMPDNSALRTEVQNVLRTRNRTRYAKVLLGLDRGLTDQQMVEEACLAGEPVDAKRIAWVRETVRMTLDGEVATTKSRAQNQAGLYRELKLYPKSKLLSQHIATRLAQLQKVDPTISAEPLGEVNLGSNTRPAVRKSQPSCEACHLTPCWCD